MGRKPGDIRSDKEKLANKIRMRKVYQTDEEYADKRRAYIKKRKTRRKYWLNKYKEAKGCVKCGGKFPAAVYDWHHIQGKDFNINERMTTNLKVLMKEIRRCILVCSNCHRIIHNG